MTCPRPDWRGGGLSRQNSAVFQALQIPKVEPSQGSYARAGSSWGGGERHTYRSGPSWSRRVPRRSVAPTAATGRAAVSRHTAAAGGRAYAAACGAEAGLLSWRAGGHTGAVSCVLIFAPWTFSPSCQLRGHEDHGFVFTDVEAEAQRRKGTVLGVLSLATLAGTHQHCTLTAPTLLFPG